MSFNPALTSSTSGAILKSAYSAIVEETVPTTPLEPSHPFHKLWRDHLAELINPGLYNSVIDALVDLVREATTRKNPLAATSHTLQTESPRDAIRHLLATHPPDIVVINGLPGAYGLHVRREKMWPFICISNDYIALWSAEQDTTVKLALLTVLKATIDHELGHWARTLVSIGLHHT